MSLTDASIRNAKPGHKPIRLFDGGGLYLEISPNGGKWWRFKYRIGGKDKRLSLGVYPDTPLAGRKDAITGKRIVGARDKRDQARQILSRGIDPGVQRKAAKSAAVERAANSFEAVTREWYAKNSKIWARVHGDRIIRRFERDIFPWIGSCSIANLGRRFVASNRLACRNSKLSSQWGHAANSPRALTRSSIVDTWCLLDCHWSPNSGWVSSMTLAYASLLPDEHALAPRVLEWGQSRLSSSLSSSNGAHRSIPLGLPRFR